MPTTAAPDAAARAVRDHVGSRLDGWLQLVGELAAIDSGAEEAAEGIVAACTAFAAEDPT